MRNLTILLLLTVLFLVCLGCSKPTDVEQAGNGTQTGNALVSGHLYKANSPAIGAKVYFVKVNYDPYSRTLSKAFAISDTVTTDSTGKYGTNDLDTGTYNVLGAGTDGNLSLLDSVHVAGDSQVVPPDTLKQPGSLAGFIKMQGTDDPRTVFVIPLGTNGFVNTGISGSFSLSNMAEGQYSVRFLSILDRYLPLDTTFTITAGVPLTLPDSIRLPLKIPTPTGFKISYDTLKQIVTLSWNKINTARVKGYNMYRQRIDTAAEVKLNSLPIVGTSYLDSTGIQDQTYIYSVVAVDFENKEGIRTPGDTVKIIGAFNLLKTLGMMGSAPGQLYGPLGMVLRNDTIFVVENGNKRVQLIDTVGNSLKTFDSTLSNPQAISVLGDKIYIADNSNIKIYNLTGMLLKTLTISVGSISDVKAITEDSLLVVAAKKVFWIDSLGALRDSSSYSFNNPKRVVLVDTTIIVTDQNIRKIVLFNRSLSYLKEVTIIEKPTTGASSNWVSSITADEAHNVYVGTFEGAGKIVLVNPDYSFLGRFTIYSAPGDYTYARDLAVKNNVLFVLNSNSTIELYRRR